MSRTRSGRPESGESFLRKLRGRLLFPSDEFVSIVAVKRRKDFQFERRFTIRIPLTLLRGLEKRAKGNGDTVSDEIRGAIRKYLEEGVST